MPDRKPMHLSSVHRWLGAAGLVAIVMGGVTSVPVAAPFIPAPFKEPTVFASQNGVLNLLMIATPQPIPTIPFVPPGVGTPKIIFPTGWVYEVCQRPASGDQCPAGAGTAAEYGGVRLALKQGDTLKIHFVNNLPPLDPNKLTHSGELGQENIALNATNIHTHGVLTPARAATTADNTWGDDVFVEVFNPANGMPVPPAASHQDGPMIVGPIDYSITIPKNHPSGLFWFHPHLHGLALNQVSQGLAGVITIGQVGDFAKGDMHQTPFPESAVRYLTLKEIQVLAAGTVQFDKGPQPVVNGEVLNQEDPDFCPQSPANGEVRRGVCAGQDNSEDGGSNFVGGKWFFTVSGQQYPTIRVTDPDGEVWRLTLRRAASATICSWSTTLAKSPW